MLNAIRDMLCFICFLFFLGWASNEALAEESHEVIVSCCSDHADKTHEYNEKNFGLHYKYISNENEVFAIGTFKNSFDRQSTYISAGYRWELNADISLELIGGLTTGYKDHPTPFALPTVNLFDVVHVHYIPGVVTAVSFTILKW